MFSKEMGRRKFMKNISSAFLGVVTGRFWDGNLSFAKAEKSPTLEYRTLGKTGMKVTVVSMGVMNCTDPSVIHRAFDLGINFYDTAPSYTRGTNEEMVGNGLKGQTRKGVHSDKSPRSRRKTDAGFCGTESTAAPNRLYRYTGMAWSPLSSRRSQILSCLISCQR